MTQISGPEQLAAFRSTWDGKQMLKLLQKHLGRLRVDWAVGVGKSTSIDATIEEAILSGQYDLVIALFPTRQIIDERHWVKNPPSGINLVNLQPRPAALCGPDINRRWQTFEKNNLGTYGRIELCGHCLWRQDCFWPEQFGGSLAGSQVIYGTQAHLERSPFFLDQLRLWSEAERVLIILDEANFIMKPFRRKISREQLETFVRVLEGLNPRQRVRQHDQWKYLCRLLLVAPTEDLRSYDWKFPFITPGWSLAVQSRGFELFSDAFTFPAFELVHFCRSQLESRERADNGDLLFSVAPNVAMDFIIYSGTAHQEFSQYRLGNEFASPFADCTFNHPESTWFNISSRLGAKKYFKKNSPQIFDFFAGLTAKRILEGKRPLLIAKKCFASLCAKEIERRLKKHGLDVRVVISGWQEHLLKDPKIIPLIHYGLIGTNLFEDFDCAYCLTGYYVTEEAVNGILQDLLGTDMGVPLQISIEGKPARRTAGALNKKDHGYDVHTLAQHALNHLEMDTVLQAVGRVRPYTKPREVVTFQCADHPDFPYTRDFSCLGEARNYFNIPSSRETHTKTIKTQVANAKSCGLTQRDSAGKLRVSLRTIQRYWNPTRHKPL